MKNCGIELNETLNHVNVYIDPYTIFEMTILGLCNSNFTSVDNKTLEIADTKSELKKAIDTDSKQNYLIVDSILTHHESSWNKYLADAINWWLENLD